MIGGPGFGDAVAGEMLRGCLPIVLVLFAALIGLGLLIGWVFF